MDNGTSGVCGGVTEAMRLHADAVYRVLRIHLRERADVEDAFQDVFIRLMETQTVFESEEHRKAWLLRTAINRSRDFYRSFWRRRVGSIEEMEIPWEDEREIGVMDAVLSLPPKWRDLIHLYYYEGYRVPELARMLGKKENTLHSDLHRARKALKRKLGGDWDEEGIQDGDGPGQGR